MRGTRGRERGCSREKGGKRWGAGKGAKRENERGGPRGQKESENTGHCAKRIRYCYTFFKKGVHSWRNAAPGLCRKEKGVGGKRGERKGEGNSGHT